MVGIAAGVTPSANAVINNPRPRHPGAARSSASPRPSRRSEASSARLEERQSPRPSISDHLHRHQHLDVLQRGRRPAGDPVWCRLDAEEARSDGTATATSSCLKPFLPSVAD
ncbi:MAG: hypothetical protein R2849_21510 [Thermomicrobiales bacterium]